MALPPECMNRLGDRVYYLETFNACNLIQLWPLSVSAFTRHGMWALCVLAVTRHEYVGIVCIGCYETRVCGHCVYWRLRDKCMWALRVLTVTRHVYVGI